MKFLGVLLCYNDGDLLEESIRWLRELNHDVVLWDHGSTDGTPQVVDRWRGELLEARRLPREFDFYDLYPAMSRHLMENYVKDYDWISWPDQDEFLEGPTRRGTYVDHLREVFESEHNWITFNNYIYWFTEADDPGQPSTLQRLRHYSLWPDGAAKIRAWRASATNIRVFNHNPPPGSAWPTNFNLRHYPMRSEALMDRRLDHDRFGLRRGDFNHHYENMLRWRDRLKLRPEQLHVDDGCSELNPDVIFNWRSIYGFPPSAEAAARRPE